MRTCNWFYRSFFFFILKPSFIFLQGFQRVFDDMPDIVLDVPLAYIMLDRFIERCSRAAFLSEKIVKNMPSRFVLRF